MPNLIRNAMRTPDGTVIESRNRHDYVSHTDANGKFYMVDGGINYIRRTAHGDEEDLSLYDDEPHEVQREVLKWGSYGKDGKQPLRLIPISEMETSHIKAVLDTCNPSLVYKNCMIKELENRDGNL